MAIFSIAADPTLRSPRDAAGPKRSRGGLGRVHSSLGAEPGQEMPGGGCAEDLLPRAATPPLAPGSGLRGTTAKSGILQDHARGGRTKPLVQLEGAGAQLDGVGGVRGVRGPHLRGTRRESAGCCPASAAAAAAE